MTIFQRIYSFFAVTQAGSVPNHLAHCVLAAGIQALLVFLLLPLGFNRAAMIATGIAIAFYVGRSQAQTEVLWSPAPWYQSWAFWSWPSDQAWGSIFPLASSLLIYAAARLVIG